MGLRPRARSLGMRWRISSNEPINPSSNPAFESTICSSPSEAQAAAPDRPITVRKNSIVSELRRAMTDFHRCGLFGGFRRNDVSVGGDQDGSSPTVGFLANGLDSSVEF